MAKAKVKETPEEQHSAALSSFASVLLGKSREDATSQSGYLLGDHAKHSWGLRLAHIVFMHVIGGSNVFPLRRMLAVSGAPKSMKSTLEIELGTWFAAAGGYFKYIDNESKSSASMFDAMTWWKFLAPGLMYTINDGAPDEKQYPLVDSQGNFCHYPASVPRNEDGWPLDMDHKDREILIQPSADPMVQTASQRVVYKKTESIDEWQDQVTDLVHGARDIVVKHPITQEPGHRVPIFGVVDSITGSETDETMQAMEKEGHAKDRGYEGASRANKIGSFLRALQFGGTCLSMGIVRHLTQNIGDGSFASKFDDKEKEAGGSLANFKASVSLRLSKGSKFGYEKDPCMPVQGPPVEGYPVRMECKFSCLGPDINRSAFVDVMWQFVEMPNGASRQIIVYDWGSALANLLYRKKYGEHTAYQYDIDRLDQALLFTAGPKANTVCCPLLAREGDPETKDGKQYMTFTAFGSRIEANPEVAKAIRRFLNISDYPSFQEAEIDWTPPQHTEKKDKKK
jgi:hypothetical protein